MPAAASRTDDSLLAALQPDGRADRIRTIGTQDAILVLTEEPFSPALAPPPPGVRWPTGWRAGWIPASPGQTVTLEHEGLSVAATAGSLPGPADERALPGSPDDCADRLFPARVAGGLAGCSAPGRVDRWNAEELPVTPRSSAAGVAAWGLAVADQMTGIWAPEGSRLTVNRTPALVDRPAAGATQIVVGTSDRLLVGEAGSGARRVIGATPAAGRGGPSVARDHVAWIDGSSRPELRIREAGGGVVVWPGAVDPAYPLLADGWLTWTDVGGVRGLGLRGQRGWTAAGNAGFSDGHGAVDDWRLVPDRSRAGITIRAVHLPTGASVVVWDDPDQWVRLRGADPSGLTAEVRRAGEVGALKERPIALRVLEEDGAIASGGLVSAAGGHGGSHGALAAGARYSVTAPPGLAGPIAVWAHPGGSGSIQVTQSQRPVARAAVEPEHDGWLRLGAVDRGAPITITWAAGPDGLAVDAVAIGALAP